jgi:pimeloyl-ACP methyl ester carboxylesterase
MARGLFVLIIRVPAAGGQSIAFSAVRVATPRGDVEAEAGSFSVRALRGKADTARFSLHVLRFRARNAPSGPPIIYLAGGPGVSGISAAGGPGWPLFNSLLDVADVILLDQRGTGRSGELPRCTSGQPVPDTLATQREQFITVFAKQVRHCRAFWASRGIDLRAYNTEESAADLEDLRRALGVPQLDLLATSYGTHLALAAIKRFPGSFRRIVLASAEGLDQTVKLPSASDAFFERVRASIARDAGARTAYPDPVAMLRRVVRRAADSAVTVRVEREGNLVSIRLGAFEIQRMAADRVADPRGTAEVLAAFAAADRGDWSLLGAWAQRRTGEPISLSPMALAMDMASGVSATRRERVLRESPGAILGDALGYPVLHVADAMDDLVLPEGFRAPQRSDHEVLILAGDLDGRTPLEENLDVAAQFTRATFVTLVNGGHSAGLNTVLGQERIRAFLASGSVSPEAILLPAPRWTP